MIAIKVNNGTGTVIVREKRRNDIQTINTHKGDIDDDDDDNSERICTSIPPHQEQTDFIYII